MERGWLATVYCGPARSKERRIGESREQHAVLHSEWQEVERDNGHGGSAETAARLLRACRGGSVTDGSSSKIAAASLCLSRAGRRDCGVPSPMSADVTCAPALRGRSLGPVWCDPWQTTIGLSGDPTEKLGVPRRPTVFSPPFLRLVAFQGDSGTLTAAARQL